MRENGGVMVSPSRRAQSAPWYRVLSQLIPAAVRRRGADYFVGRRVTLVHADAHRVEARVRGSRTYGVEIDIGDSAGLPSLSCTCPYYDGTGYCKHIWATVLAATVQEAPATGETSVSAIENAIDGAMDAYARAHAARALPRRQTERGPRQAACHPGLIDQARAADASAKFDVLLSQLADVVAEGHKALVFSQFTSLLALVKTRLDGQGITYEYLDGKTRARQARVERFQHDEACPVFLISLKAGGQGLNLTAADYVFILDPWWNPAVEAQAVDRTHRIGQTKRVFAIRLITRDTVEEKVLELQRSKRELADAILTADQGLIARIGRQELELLLA
jgi:hypothetical protein